MSTPLRGKCGQCGRRFRMTVEGVLYAHNSVERHDGVWISDMCTGSGTEPAEGSVRAPRVEYGPVPDQSAAPQWSWWEEHGYYVWMAGVWVSGFLVGGALAIIIRNLAEGRGWLG